MIAYSAARRTKEIGIRVALGARPGAVVRLVMRQGLVVALAGLLAGSRSPAWSPPRQARMISGVLYRVSVSDPFVGVAAVVLLTV